MAAYCKRCGVRVDPKNKREDRLCPVCAGVKKRCIRCHNFYEIEVEGDFCPACEARRERRKANGQNPEPPRKVDYKDDARLAKLSHAYVKFGLHKIDWEAVKNGNAS